MKAHFWMDAPHVLGGIDQGTHLAHHKKFLRKSSSPRSASPSPIPQENKDNLNPKTTDDESPCIEHGTWLAFTQCGRFSFVTNFREPFSQVNLHAKSRGLLTKNFVTGPLNTSPEEYMKDLAKEKKETYNGFNLVVGNVNGPCLAYGNRQSQDPIVLKDAAVYGISNGPFSGDQIDPWPKVERGKSLFREALKSRSTSALELKKALLQVIQCVPLIFQKLSLLIYSRKIIITETSKFFRTKNYPQTCLTMIWRNGSRPSVLIANDLTKATMEQGLILLY